MGFISGLAVRGKYRIQGHFSIPKLKEPFGYELRKNSESRLTGEEEYGIETFEKYPIPDVEKDESLFQVFPHYNGVTNCFYVEQFAIERDYEYQSLYLIMAAFEYFPRVDYCMLLFPYGTLQVPFLRSQFQSIPLRPFSAYDKELFVFHKAAFNRSPEVRLYAEGDLKGVKRLIQSSCLKDYLLKDLESSLKGKETELQAVVLLSEGQIFGIAIIGEMKNPEVMRKKYDIAELINMKYHRHSPGQVLHCVLHPVFKYFSSIFLKEVMHLCQKSILYYKVYPTHLIPYDPSLWQSLCNVIEHFLPLTLTRKANHKIKSYIEINTKEDNDEQQNNSEDTYYCLCYTCTKLVLKDKRIISLRIVVLGESSVVLSILENLIYRYDYKYTNITVISRSGILENYKLGDRCNSFLPTETDYSKSELESLCLPAWVTIIRGKVTSIKRNALRLRELSKNKPRSFSVGFDYLVICEELQYQTLYPKKPTTIKRHKNDKFSLLSGLQQERYSVAKSPSNVFAVNNVHEAAQVLNWMWRYFLKKVESREQPKKKYRNLAEMERDKLEGRIVIYGNDLEAYTALTVILAEDFPLSKITFVKSKRNANHRMRFSAFVEEAMDHVLSEAGIEMFPNATIEYDKEAEEVFSLDVATQAGATRLDCCMLLLFREKKVNYNTFKTLHESPLSFTLPLNNSKDHPYLLINAKFETNIRNIFAVGSIAEMRAELGESIRLEDCAYNKRELGKIIGENISNVSTQDVCSSENAFPVLTHPEVTHARLPYGYFYGFIACPDTRFASENEKGEELEHRVQSLVLGNMKSGADIVPAPMTEEEKDLLAEDVTSKEKIAYQEFLLEMRDFVQEEKEELEIELAKIERILPDEPECFAFTFDENEAVKSIEFLTKLDIDVVILKNLCGVHVTQLFKILQKVKKETGEVEFHLNQTWKLALDHVVFDEDIKLKKRGYESYWRPGYPQNIEERLNGFLDSFSSYKESAK